MKAGTTKNNVGTKIKIISSSDKDLIGVTGELTHPFAGLKAENTKYIAGLRIDQDGVYSDNKCNLMENDKFEVIEEA